MTFFEYFQPNTNPPMVEVDRTGSSDGEYLLAMAHERMITYHEYVPTFNFLLFFLKIFGT